MSRHCKSIELAENPGPIMKVLEDNPSLHDGYINYNLILTLPTMEMSSFEGDSTSNQPLNWSTLDSQQLNLSFSRVITRRMPHLVRLSVGGSIESLIQLATNLPSFPRLQNLSLGIWHNNQAVLERSLSTSFPVNESVHSLSISLVTGTGLDRLVGRIEIQRQFCRWTIQALPAIQRLSLSIARPSISTSLSEVFDIRELDDFTYLQRLTLATPLAVDSDELPSCEILTLKDVSSRTMARPSNRTTRTLYVQNYRQSQINFGLSDQSWPCIEKMLIPAYLIANS